MGPGDLATEVRRIGADALRVARGTTRGGRRSRRACAGSTSRLRVAIAGRVKAGKSTLLNALVGERLAATDAGECTRIVTWYRQRARLPASSPTLRGRRLARPARSAARMARSRSTSATSPSTTIERTRGRLAVAEARPT